MTTISYKDGIMAFDSRHEWAGIKFKCNQPKAIKTKKHLVGCAGSKVICIRFMDYCKNNFGGEMPKMDEGMEALIVNRDSGKIQLLPNGGHKELVDIDDIFFAVGSGAGYALGAMATGKTAIEAVKIACKYDSGSSGPVKSIKI